MMRRTRRHPKALRARFAVGSCGDKKLVTAFGGRTFDEPCHKEGALLDLGICTVEDVRVWRARIDDLLSIALDNWNRLLDLENEKQSWTESRKVRSWYDNVIERVKALPEPNFFDEWVMPVGPEMHEMIARMMGIVQDLACLIEELRAGIVAQGGKPGRVPYIEPRPPKPSFVSRIASSTTDAIDDTRKTLTRGIVIAGVVVGLAYVFRPVLEKQLAGRASRGSKESSP